MTLLDVGSAVGMLDEVRVGVCGGGGFSCKPLVILLRSRGEVCNCLDSCSVD